MRRVSYRCLKTNPNEESETIPGAIGKVTCFNIVSLQELKRYTNEVPRWVDDPILIEV